MGPWRMLEYGWFGLIIPPGPGPALPICGGGVNPDLCCIYNKNIFISIIYTFFIIFFIDHNYTIIKHYK